MQQMAPQRVIISLAWRRAIFFSTFPSKQSLDPNALLEVALTLEAYPEAGLIYSDEDQVDANNQRQNPIFKPAWSPDLFDVIDYLGHLTVIESKSSHSGGRMEE